jgi:signal peptidase I
MTLDQLILFFLALQVIHFLGTWKLYQKAGRKPWEAAVPVYNAIILMKIINRPWWWVILLFIPVVNLIMFPVVWVETLRSFGKNSTTDTILGIVTFGLYIYYINYSGTADYVGPDRSLQPPSKTGDTISSLLFAVVVATIVHTYVIQPFNIPSSSLEKTLLVGDYLFVSKVHYGARTPKTAVAFPMVHDTIPVLNVRSYLNWPQLPSFRLPGFSEVKKNDIVVFNWPADTTTNMNDRTTVGLRKPVDKRTNYVKRCVGTPGDNLSIKDGVVYVDGKVLQLSDRAKPQFSYIVTTDGSLMNPQYLIKELKITDGFQQIDEKRWYFKALTDETAGRLKQNPGIMSVERYKQADTDPGIFPKGAPWNGDNMGPIYIPEEGKTVAINKQNLPLYEKIIGEYENNDLKVSGDQIIINGKPATSYTFKQNYYWLMGDNRHNSLDSRYWGFVPEDHIVGKAVFVWWSTDQTETWKNFTKKIRWDRVFTTVGGDGEPVSYFKYFVIFLGGYLIFDYFRKKKSKEAA